MNLVSQENLDHLVSGGKSLVEVISGSTTELVNEAINLFIIEGVLSVLKFASIFVVFYIVKRYCDVMSADGGHVKLFKAAKTTALVLSIMYFVTMSFPHIVLISKAIVAPRIFLIEKASELRGSK